MERGRGDGGTIKDPVFCGGNVFCIAINICQIAAGTEREARDGCHTLRNGDAGQVCAFIKGAVTNVGEACWDGDTGEPATAVEDKIADAGDTL